MIQATPYMAVNQEAPWHIQSCQVEHVKFLES